MLAIGIEVRCCVSYVRVAERRGRRLQSVITAVRIRPRTFLGEWLSGNSSGLQNHHTQVRVLPLLFRSIAQLAERRALNAEVPGSSPGRPVGDVAELANAPVC